MFRGCKIFLGLRRDFFRSNNSCDGGLRKRCARSPRSCGRFWIGVSPVDTDLVEITGTDKAIAVEVAVANKIEATGCKCT